MKTLIVEDDVTGRLILQRLLTPYGECHLVVNGQEAIKAFGEALDAGQPYDLICLDIMMPEMDGHAALKKIREMEAKRGFFSTGGAKIIMTTALNDMKNIAAAYRQLCDGYLVKPIDKAKLIARLKDLKILPEKAR